MTLQSGDQESPELRELRKISKILLLANGSSIERQLSTVAKTDERRKIWVMIDGIRTQDEIAKSLGLGRRTVNIFIALLETADLVDAPRGKPPMRTLDFVPPGWLDLVKPASEDSVASAETKESTRTQEENQ